jgi:predicted RNase H-like nuclease
MPLLPAEPPSLIVGFDSAWTSTNTGAIVGALFDDQGAVRELGHPQAVRYREAAEIISAWQQMHLPSTTLVLLDQPTIVANNTGQRPVEQIVCPTISRRRGGMQPANTGRDNMFGATAPVWAFLERLGASLDAFAGAARTRVLETYPVLAIVALGWTLPDPERPAGRLPKYNPGRRKTFGIADWAHVCRATGARLKAEGATGLAAWSADAAGNPKPTKTDQDRLDACICLLVALHVVKGRDALFVGNCSTGHIVVPNAAPLLAEIQAQCARLGRQPSDWVRVSRLISRGTETTLSTPCP